MDGCEDVWKYVVSLYARESVSSRCLYLQDQHGFNVSLLLFTLWVSQRHGLLTTTETEACSKLANVWETAVVSKLREVRRWMKADHEIKPAAAFEDLRQAIKGQEVEAERVLLLGLENIVAQQPDSLVGGEDLWEALAGNLERLFSSQRWMSEVVTRITAIAGVAFADPSQEDLDRLAARLKHISSV